jgi:hypothetical protein
MYEIEIGDLDVTKTGINVLMCSASYLAFSSEHSRSSMSAWVRQESLHSESLVDTNGANLERRSRT